MIFCTCGENGYCVAHDAIWRRGKSHPLNPELNSARSTPSRLRRATEHTKSASKGECRRSERAEATAKRRKADNPA